MAKAISPLEQLLANYWGRDPEKLLALIEERFGVRVPPERLRESSDAFSFAAALKGQVDHPGRLERVAEHLLTMKAAS
jgi:hypothetical protein